MARKERQEQIAAARNARDQGFADCKAQFPEGSKQYVAKKPVTPLPQRLPMPNYGAALASVALTLLFPTTLAQSQELHTGVAAFGDWRTDAPGVIRKITPADLPLPQPAATPSSANRSSVVGKPAGATLQTMPGFSVEPFVTCLPGARVIRIAPNGNIFVALSRSEGRIVVIRTGSDMTSQKVETFASGLRDPYGIAFYPPCLGSAVGVCRPSRRGATLSVSQRRHRGLGRAADAGVRSRDRRQSPDARLGVLPQRPGHVCRGPLRQQRGGV
ncbi:MAG: hypothetical protein P4M05_13015 [Bradyrhizobium sp.]|nr:hypothetical protein [Bradyrhizobium sp.]